MYINNKYVKDGEIDASKFFTQEEILPFDIDTKEMFEEVKKTHMDRGYPAITLSINGKEAKYAVDALRTAPKSDLFSSEYEMEYSIGMTKLREIKKRTEHKR